MSHQDEMKNVFPLITVLIAVVVSSSGLWKGLFVSKQLRIVNVYMSIASGIPDPADIKNTGQWYLLGHISSGVSHFNHITGKFEPLLADVESYSGGAHTYTLRESAKFSDGTPVTAIDFVASLKRILILKTSTHFPLWKYVEGCDQLKTMVDECTGLKIISDRKVEIRLKVPVENFNLQMSSPETGIWYHGDIDENSKSLAINPTRFSGPYSLSHHDEAGFELVRNSHNPISQQFVDSPAKINVRILKSKDVEAAMIGSKIDLVIRSHNPYDETDYNKIGFGIYSSAPATLLYLHGAGMSSRRRITKQFVNELWKSNSDSSIIPADNFLPFDPSLSLKREEFLSALPDSSKGVGPIRIGVPWTYLSNAFYRFLESSGVRAGLNIKLIPLTPDEWGNALTTPDAPKGIDYILAIYAASERYPAVQLRYIAGTVRGPSQTSLDAADAPDLSTEKKEELREFQKALLSHQYAVPLFFSKHQLTFRTSLIDVGDQPPSDAEVELWRMTKK